MLPYVLRIKSLYGAIIFGGDNITRQKTSRFPGVRTQKSPHYGGPGFGRESLSEENHSDVVYIAVARAFGKPAERTSPRIPPISSS